MTSHDTLLNLNFLLDDLMNHSSVLAIKNSVVRVAEPLANLNTWKSAGYCWASYKAI